MALSDAACRSLKPKAKPYKKGDAHGLFLFIMPNGSKLWRFKYRFAGKEKVLSIGPYPEISLAEAREERDKARKLHRSGKDPSLAKQEKRRLAALSAATTFEAIAREWHAKNIVKWSDNHQRTVMRRLESDLFPQMGNIPIAEISTPRLVAAIEEGQGAADCRLCGWPAPF